MSTIMPFDAAPLQSLLPRPGSPAYISYLKTQLTLANQRIKELEKGRGAEVQHLSVESMRIMVEGIFKQVLQGRGQI